ncbi:MAG TPA: ferredoxin [Acidothermaceae bacterium]|nr:ferredoxin [Acidothermaceae bacterium]
MATKSPTGRSSSRRTGPTLAVDWTACDGRGLCAELLPELIKRDDWGFPLISDDAVPAHLLDFAERAVDVCPTMALKLGR